MKRALCSAFVLPLLFAAYAYAAPVTIDTFETPTSPFAATGTGPLNRIDTGPGIFGLRRLLTSTVIPPGDPIVLGAGIFELLQLTTTGATGPILQYGFPAVQDFSADLGVEFRFLFLDAPGITGGKS